MLVAVLSMSSSDLVSDCVDESKKYLQHIISTCGAKLVERIAEDYGLSQDELLEKYNLKVTNGVAVERPKPSPSKPSTSSTAAISISASYPGRPNLRPVQTELDTRC